MARRILLACTDLFFASKVRETARHAGAAILPDIAAWPPDEEPQLAIVDLDATSFDPLQLVRDLRGRLGERVSIVAFVRHDKVELVKSAREAGADKVLSRGAFSERLPSLLG
ncbi:MAG TPA: hypothetical protein VGD74_00190 [Vulgatibacter sp.]